MFLGLAAGLVAGVVSGLVRVHMGGGTVDTWGNSIGVWLLVPLVAGLFAPSWRRAIVAGVLASTTQMAVFYAVTGTDDAMAFWFAAAVGAGAVSGWVGNAGRVRWCGLTAR
jgi:hypothetical protein